MWKCKRNGNKIWHWTEKWVKWELDTPEQQDMGACN